MKDSKNIYQRIDEIIDGHLSGIINLHTRNDIKRNLFDVVQDALIKEIESNRKLMNSILQTKNL